MIYGKPINVALYLVGECSQCGLCCTMEHDSKTFFCENLNYEDFNDVLAGKSGATSCRVYETRHDRMPIKMFNLDGECLAGDHYCWAGSIQETRAILTSGVGRGCSLNLRIRERSQEAPL